MRAKLREAETLSLPIWWAPSLTWGARQNAKLHETYLTLSNEWQAFVGRRVGEDLQLLKQIGSTKSAAQFWDAYIKFLQKAAEDYTHEYAVAAKIAASSVLSAISVPERALGVSRAAAPPFSKVA